MPRLRSRDAGGLRRRCARTPGGYNTRGRLPGSVAGPPPNAGVQGEVGVIGPVRGYAGLGLAWRSRGMFRGTKLRTSHQGDRESLSWPVGRGVRQTLLTTMPGGRGRPASPRGAGRPAQRGASSNSTVRGVPLSQTIRSVPSSVRRCPSRTAPPGANLLPVQPDSAGLAPALHDEGGVDHRRTFAGFQGQGQRGVEIVRRAAQEYAFSPGRSLRSRRRRR